MEPNEITVEAPYIAHNIEFTRRAFKLNAVEEREFPVNERFTQRMVRDNRGTFDNVRLWDWRALTSVYEQFQEIRLYYDFQEVDVDRYSFADNYREVMVSAREMNLENLPPQGHPAVQKCRSKSSLAGPTRLSMLICRPSAARTSRERLLN